jgi:hypothetical protein
MDPATAFSYDPKRAPFSRGLRTTDGFFDWLERPWNEARLRRFGPAMGGAQFAPPEASLHGMLRSRLFLIHLTLLLDQVLTGSPSRRARW